MDKVRIANLKKKQMKNDKLIKMYLKKEKRKLLLKVKNAFNVLDQFQASIKKIFYLFLSVQKRLKKVLFERKVNNDLKVMK